MKKRDIILIASVLIVAAALFLVLELTKEAGARVIVKIETEKIFKKNRKKS